MTFCAFTDGLFAASVSVLTLWFEVRVVGDEKETVVCTFDVLPCFFLSQLSSWRWPVRGARAQLTRLPRNASGLLARSDLQLSAQQY